MTFFPVSSWAHAPIERHGYRPARSNRALSGIGTAVLCALIAAGFFVTLDHFDRPKPASTPLMVSLISIPPTRHSARKKTEKTKPLPKRPTIAKTHQVEPLPPPVIPLPSPPEPVSNSRKLAIISQPGPAQPNPSPSPSPSPPATPPAQPEARHAPDSWEGHVLARLERYRRYPADARRAREQGTAYIRFRIDRNGHVLSSSLERSSGYPALDDAAMDTLRRADPLPKIPSNRPNEVELLVPIEFFVRN